MKKSIMIAIFVISALMFASFALAVNGANTVNVIGSSERAGADTAQSEQALAGNVTELDISGDTITQTWQGYYGNVSGTVELANAAGDVMYNWSAASPTGEVLASVNQTVDWANIACASAANMTALESTYNIGASDVDGIQETFATTTGAATIASTSLSSCPNTQVYDETGASNVDFEELLLWDGDAAVFAAILEDDATGFDNLEHDFEMLVLEDGHGADVAETTYYFFVELN